VALSNSEGICGAANQGGLEEEAGIGSLLAVD